VGNEEKEGKKPTLKETNKVMKEKKTQRKTEIKREKTGMGEKTAATEEQQKQQQQKKLWK
jgi:hypothetical protein